MKKAIKIATNILLSCFLVFVWWVILYLSKFLCQFSPIIRLTGNGILKYVIFGVYGVAAMAPIIFRKKLTIAKSIPLTMIVYAIIAVAINFLILFSVKAYVSEYSRTRWDANPKMRIYMVDDMEKEHQIIGMTEAEVKTLLGEPETVLKEENVLEYYVGDSIIDPYTYDVLFENGVAVETRIWEH